MFVSGMRSGRASACAADLDPARTRAPDSERRKAAASNSRGDLLLDRLEVPLDDLDREPGLEAQI
jgi:hypothetical protein